MARAEGTFRVQGQPRLDDASSWPNYKKRLAIWMNLCNTCKMSEVHIGALVAMSMTDSCKLRANLVTRFYEVMETEKAYNTVIKFLEDELGEDTLYLS